jgi:hypothetical protein
MPTAAVLGAALTTPGTRAFVLLVGGTDVAGPPIGASRYWTELDSISVTENGPGGVSSMSFTIIDPAEEVNITRVDEVIFEQTEAGIQFRGFVQVPKEEPMPVGRTVEVTAAGIEILLDWLIVPAMTFAVGTYAFAAVQALAANATGVAGASLNTAALWSGVAGLANGSAEYPVGVLGVAQPAALADDVEISAGTTLREALRTILDGITSPFVGATETGAVATIDFYGRLRVYFRGGHPSDYDTLVVTDEIPT